MFVSARHIFVAQDRRQTAECPDTDGDKRVLKRQGLIETQRHVFFSKNSPYACQRTREQTQANLGADATESGSRDERVWEQRRMHTGWRSPKGIGAEAEAMFFRLSALFPVSGHQRQLAACTEKRRCKTRMGCATPLFIKEHLFNAL